MIRLMAATLLLCVSMSISVWREVPALELSSRETLGQWSTKTTWSK